MRTDGHTGTRLSRRRGHADALRTVDDLVLHGGRDPIVAVINARLMARPHPTLSETVAMAAEAFEGTITDLYMPKK